jgi:hypothetical protein
VQADDFFQRNSEEIEGKSLPEVFFGGERNVTQILGSPDLFRVDTLSGEESPVKGSSHGILNGSLKPLFLKLVEFLPW